MFEDYTNLLREKYPELQIDGENYIPPGANMMLAKGLVRFLSRIIIKSHLASVPMSMSLFAEYSQDSSHCFNIPQSKSIPMDWTTSAILVAMVYG